jgi:hypothetical protein
MSSPSFIRSRLRIDGFNIHSLATVFAGLAFLILALDFGSSAITRPKQFVEVNANTTFTLNKDVAEAAEITPFESPDPSPFLAVATGLEDALQKLVPAYDALTQAPVELLGSTTATRA